MAWAPGRSTVPAPMSPRQSSLLAVLVLVSCATTPAPPPPEASLPGEATVPAPKEDDLAQAFAPTPEAKPAAPAAPNIEQPPEPADRTGPFREAFSRAQAALAAKQLDEARAAATEACTQADALGADERAKAWALAFKVAQAEGNPARAQDAALAWRLACGPERLDTCRAAAVKALTQVEKLKGAPAKAVKALQKSLQDADTCVATAERSGAAPACLPAAEKTASRHQDALLAARALYARALAEKADVKKLALFEKSAARCDVPSCAGVRRRALSKLAALALAAGDLEAAVKATVRDAEVAAALVPPEARRWARTSELDRVCAKYDAAQGAGACRRVEKQLTGGYTFRDFSKDKPSGEGLSAEQVKQVNEHYAPLLQECLAEQARRLAPPDAQRYEVAWTVQNDGRVRTAHLRKDLDDTPLAKCLRAQFSSWRYPRFTGELQHVEQSFLVTAVERRANVR